MSFTRRIGELSAPPEPEFWPCLRPLLAISSDDEAPWVPPSIVVVLAKPRVYLKGGPKWPWRLPRPRRPREIQADTVIRHSLAYRHRSEIVAPPWWEVEE